ncbi:hypothetical protein B0H21DRAFT_892188 [Amylocystis lapponica]|nr:hypothetical protein B0H21DRAFT_892188 [Amylocystis lapponica]
MHLATLPNLITAGINVSDILQDGVSPSSTFLLATPLFPQLQNLSITFTQLDAFSMQLFDLTQTASLEALRIITLGHPHPSVLHDHLETISRRPFSPTITSLRLHFPVTLPTDLPPPDVPQFALHLDNIQPLLRMKSLQKLEIKSLYLELENSDIATLAAALPALQPLRLVSPYYAGRTRARRSTHSAATLPCPPPACLAALYRLEVEYSPISRPAAVAAFLSMFSTRHPLGVFARRPAQADGDKQVHEVHCRQWQQVNLLLPLFTEVRKQERSARPAES